MPTHFENLEQLFYRKTKISREDLNTLFDAVGIPKETCWRGIYRMILEIPISSNSDMGGKANNSKFESLVKMALLYIRAGVYTEKALLSLIENYNSIYFSGYESRLTESLDDLDFLIDQFKTMSVERHENVKELESETVKTVESNLSLDKKIQLIRLKFKETIAKFQEDLKRVDQMANLDHLTGLYNRRFFDNELEKEISQALKEKTWFSLLLIDIDDFKTINDNDGHQIGDQTLKMVARQLQSLCHKESEKSGVAFSLSRYGGEEFSILLPTIDRKRAAGIAEIIRENIEQYDFIIPGKGGQVEDKKLKLTISIGVAALDHSYGVSKNLETIVKKADKAMYEAKNAGKNCVKSL